MCVSKGNVRDVGLPCILNEGNPGREGAERIFLNIGVKRSIYLRNYITIGQYKHIRL